MYRDIAFGSCNNISSLQKKSYCTNHSAISVLLYNTIAELLLKIFLLCKLLAPRVNITTNCTPCNISTYSRQRDQLSTNER